MAEQNIIAWQIEFENGTVELWPETLTENRHLVAG